MVLRGVRVTSPWVWIAVGVAATHVGWACVFAGWWTWLLRGKNKTARRAKIERDFSDVRRTIREHTHQWN